MDRPEQAATLGGVIRAARKGLGLSTRQLAQASGVPQPTIVHIELGDTRQPSPEHLNRLAPALHLPSAELYALAGYTAPTDLPALPTYLRTKYRDMPGDAQAEVETFIARMQHKYGFDSSEAKPEGELEDK